MIQERLATADAGAGAPRRWKWRGEDLPRLAEAGVFSPEQKIELINGEIIEIMPPSPRHSALIAAIAETLGRLFGSDAFHVRAENPIRLNEYYEPQPDLAVVRGRPLDYVERYPVPGDVVLLIEVADTSLDFDRSEKLSGYAAAGIRDYWIVNLRDGQVEVYREPAGPEYLFRRIYRPGESLSPRELPEGSVSVNDLLGR